MNVIIKNFQQKIRATQSPAEKQQLTAALKEYVLTLSAKEQEAYRQLVIANIESKFEVMDKIIETYETMKKDYLQFA